MNGAVPVREALEARGVRFFFADVEDLTVGGIFVKREAHSTNRLGFRLGFVEFPLRFSMVYESNVF